MTSRIWVSYSREGASQVALVVKNLPANAGNEMQVRSLGQGGPLGEIMATHASILAWRIPWTEEPDRIQSTGSHGTGHS